MPRGDKTGPGGLGPMTGRRMGYCAGNDNPGFNNNSKFGFGLGKGFRGGQVRRKGQHGFGRNQIHSENQEISATDQKSVIENEIEILKQQLSFLEKELEKLH
ncbi:DUF5320 domain-containing protein [Bacteroidota bacterium]